MLPTGKYAGCKHWDAVIETARGIPRLKQLVANYDRTKHPAVLNALMDNATMEMWVAYYRGTQPS